MMRALTQMRMGLQRMKWTRRGLVVLGVLALVGVSVGYLAGVRLVWNPPAQLEAARARWQAQGTQDYRLLVEVQAPFTTGGLYQLDVANGIVTAASVYNPPTFRLDPNAPAFELAPSQGAPYTVAALFRRATDLQDDLPRPQLYLPNSTHVTYSDTGHVARLVDNTCGWALTLVAECVTRIEVLRLEPR